MLVMLRKHVDACNALPSICTPVANRKIDEFIIDVRRFHYLQSLHAWNILTKSFEQWIIGT